MLPSTSVIVLPFMINPSDCVFPASSAANVEMGPAHGNLLENGTRWKKKFDPCRNKCQLFFSEDDGI